MAFRSGDGVMFVAPVAGSAIFGTVTEGRDEVWARQVALLSEGCCPICGRPLDREDGLALCPITHISYVLRRAEGEERLFSTDGMVIESTSDWRRGGAQPVLTCDATDLTGVDTTSEEFCPQPAESDRRSP